MNLEPRNSSLLSTDIVLALRRRIALLFWLPVLLISVAALLAYQVLPEIYQTSTTLLVTRAPTEDRTIYNDLMINRQIVKTYREIVLSNAVLREAASRIQLDLTTGELRSLVQVSQRGETEVFEISAQHEDPEIAASLADSVAEAFIEGIGQIMQVENVAVIDVAEVPHHPVKPQRLLLICLGALAGLFCSVAAVIVLEWMDRSFRTVEQIEQMLGLPVLASIPRFQVTDETGDKHAE